MIKKNILILLFGLLICISDGLRIETSNNMPLSQAISPTATLFSHVDPEDIFMLASPILYCRQSDGKSSYAFTISLKAAAECRRIYEILQNKLFITSHVLDATRMLSKISSIRLTVDIPSPEEEKKYPSPILYYTNDLVKALIEGASNTIDIAIGYKAPLFNRMPIPPEVPQAQDRIFRIALQTPFIVDAGLDGTPLPLYLQGPFDKQVID